MKALLALLLRRRSRRRQALARARRPFREVFAEAQAAHDGEACGGTAGGCRFEPAHAP